MKSMDLDQLANIQNLAIELQVLRRLRNSVLGFSIQVKYEDKQSIINAYEFARRSEIENTIQAFAKISSKDLESGDEWENSEDFLESIYGFIENFIRSRETEIETEFDNIGIKIEDLK